MKQILPIALVLAASVIGLTLVVLGVSPHPTIPEHLPPSATPRPSIPRPVSQLVTPARMPTSSPSSVPSPPTPAAGLSIPAVGIDVPLLPLGISPTGIVRPPSFGDAYYLSGSEFSAPGSAPTGRPVVIAFHASTDPTAGAVGNHLWDRVHSTARIHEGDVVFVKGVAYTVTRTEVTPKLGATRGPEWTEPGRLILVTCAEDSSGRPASSNLVVYGTVTSAAHK